LTQRMQTSSLIVRFAKPANQDTLLSINGVISVDELENGCLRIHHDPESSPAARIAEVAVSQGWGLLELTPDKRSLEEIFVDITTSETDLNETTEIAAA